MKKTLITLLSLTICCLILVSCGSSSSDEPADSNEPEVTKIEKSVDAVGEALGLTAGDETLYEYIGATAGREFNDGAIEIYQYDTSSDEYTAIESDGAISGITVSAYKDGMVLIFSGEEDADVKAAFEALEFK